jgi:propanol-preferring alcohol dehydrogenase
LRAFVLDNFGERLKLKDVPIPKLSADEVLVRVKACGIGLTLSWIRLGRMNATVPRIIGHEIAGTVDKVGPDVTDKSPGDPVAVYFYITCGHCKYCESDRETTCVNFEGNVGTRIDGGFAEFVKLPARNLFKFSTEKVDFVKASIISVAIATPLHIAERKAAIDPMDKVLVIGAGGGVGIHMVQMAKVFGAEVFAADISKEKLDLAKKYGADHTINAEEEKIDESVGRLTRKKGVDIAIDFVSSPKSTSAAFQSLAPQGKLVLLGHFHPEDPLHLEDPQAIIRNEISIIGSRYATKGELREAIEMVEKGLVEPVVTKTYRFDEADKALEDVEEGKIAGRAVLEIS